jgi:hypothetical protein
MHWNYRVVRKSYNTNDGETHQMFGIHEVYYDDFGEVKYITTKPLDAYGDTPEELQEDLKEMLKAFDKPILEFNKDKSV